MQSIQVQTLLLSCIIHIQTPRTEYIHRKWGEPYRTLSGHDSTQTRRNFWSSSCEEFHSNTIILLMNHFPIDECTFPLPPPLPQSIRFHAKRREKWRKLAEAFFTTVISRLDYNIPCPLVISNIDFFSLHVWMTELGKLNNSISRSLIGLPNEHILELD